MHRVIYYAIYIIYFLYIYIYKYVSVQRRSGNGENNAWRVKKSSVLFVVIVINTFVPTLSHKKQLQVWNFYQHEYDMRNGNQK